jgi:thiol:disulfide interchange protein DsbA
MLKKTSLLAILLAIAACGGPTEPAADTEALEADGAEAIVEPELVATTDGAPLTTARFELGRHYLRLSPTQPTSSNPDQVEVCEIFWYGCPHCRDLEPLLASWVTAQPDYVSFIRVPGVWNPLVRLHARAYYTAEALGKGAEMHAEFFAEFHERRNMLDSEAKLTELFARFGVEPGAFKAAFDSVGVQIKLQRADELSRRYRLEEVPTLVVNGKYRTSGGVVATYEDLLALVDELVAAEREGR